MSNVCLYIFLCLYPLKVQARCSRHMPQMYGLSVYNSKLVGFISCQTVREKWCSGPLTTNSGLEPVPRCEPSLYQPFTDDLLLHNQGW